jgi:hypothetical protein
MSLPENFVERKQLDRERELFMHDLRCAVSRARLASSTLESVSVKLRHKSITTEQAKEWLASEGLSHHLQVGPSGGAQ